MLHLIQYDLQNTLSKIPVKIQTTTLQGLGLINEDSGELLDQPVYELIKGTRVVIYHKDQGWVTATLEQIIIKKSQSKTTNKTSNEET